MGLPSASAAPVLNANSLKLAGEAATVVIPSTPLSEFHTLVSRPSAKSISPFFSA